MDKMRPTDPMNRVHNVGGSVEDLSSTGKSVEEVGYAPDDYEKGMEDDSAIILKYPPSFRGSEGTEEMTTLGYGCGGNSSLESFGSGCGGSSGLQSFSKCGGSSSLENFGSGCGGSSSLRSF
jgi:hypothetical protein